MSGKKATTFSVCDVVPPSKMVDTFCLSSGKAKNILIILLILSKKLPLRLCELCDGCMFLDGDVMGDVATIPLFLNRKVIPLC